MGRCQTVLIIEDSPEDYEIAVRGLTKAGLRNPIRRCVDGQDALDYIFQTKRYTPETAPCPGIILLDLNLPGTDGREFLRKLKGDSQLSSIPVVVMTSSRDARDIEECEALGANTYVQKPVDLAGFLQAIQRLNGYWLEVTILSRSA
jgi:CheY-like chemotaxis protein